MTNGCMTTDDNDIIYIVGGQESILNKLPFKKTDVILVWNTSSVNHDIIDIIQFKTNQLSIQCHQNTVYSSISNQIYIAGALNARFARSGTNGSAQQYLISITTSYYAFNADTMDYQSFSPTTASANGMQLIRSCTAIAQDLHLLITFGGQYVKGFVWIQNEFELLDRLSPYNTTNLLQIFDLRTSQWIDPIHIENAPSDAMESGCFVRGNYYYVIGGTSVQNSRVLSEIMRYNIPTNEWEIIAYVPKNMCYPKAFAIPQDIMLTGVLITGHESCELDATYQFYVFDYVSFSIQHLSDFPLTNIWNPMIEIVNESIVVFGGLQRVVSYDGTTTLTRNIRNDMWLSESLSSLLIASVYPITTSHATNTSSVHLYSTGDLIDKECIGMKQANDYVLMFPICIAVFFLILIIADLLHLSISKSYHCSTCITCCYKSDTKHTLLLSLIMLRVCDMTTDVILCIQIVLYYIECNVGNPLNLLFVLSLCSIACIAIPWCINVLTMIRITKLPNVVIERPAIWFKTYMLLYVFLVIITGDCYTSTVLISSNLFSLSIFNSGLNVIQHESIQYTKVITIMCENVPQVLIQFTYGYFILKDLRPLILLSLILSLLSSIINSFSWCLSRNIDAKLGMIQYCLNIKLYHDPLEGCANHIESTMNKQLLQIKMYRGCRSELRDQIASQIGVKRTKLEIGYIQMLPNGCSIQIIQTMVESVVDKQQLSLLIDGLYDDHLDSIENVIKGVYHVQWDIEIEVEFTENMKDRDYTKMLSKMANSKRQLLQFDDDSSSDKVYLSNA